MYLALFFKKKIKRELLKKIVIGSKESDWQFLPSGIAIIETFFNDYDIKGIKERVEKSCTIVNLKFMSNRDFRIFEREIIDKFKGSDQIYNELLNKNLNLDAISAIKKISVLELRKKMYEFAIKKNVKIEFTKGGYINQIEEQE